MLVRSLTIHIRPKIHGASIEGMLNIALDAISDETTITAQPFEHWTFSLAFSFVHQAGQKYAKNMRMEGVEREESLQGRVRGRLWSAHMYVIFDQASPYSMQVHRMDAG